MIGIYTRLSKEDEVSNSIDNQIEEGKAFANRQPYKLYNEGEGVSGTLDIKKRPKLSKLMLDIQSGNITKVWMRNQNRLDRNSLTFFLFVDVCKKSDVKVYFGDGNNSLDFNDAATLLNSSILSSLNTYQVQLQSQQTKRQLHKKAQENKAWGVLPYGYDTDDNMVLVLDEKEALIVKKIFELYLEGKRSKRIANYLNEEGIKTRYASRYKGELKVNNKKTKGTLIKEKSSIIWSDTQINTILKCKWYIGERTYAKMLLKAPIIIDIVTFEKVQAIIKDNRKPKNIANEYRYLLKGIIKCGKCGRNYYGRSRQNKKDHHYMCSSKRNKLQNCGNRSVNITKTESYIIKHLFKSEMFRDDLVSRLTDGTALNDLKLREKQKKQELTIEQNTQKHLFKLLTNPVLSDDDSIITKYTNTKENIFRINKELKLIKSKIQEVTQEGKEEELNDIFNNFSISNNFKSVKESVHKLIDEILVFTKQTSPNKAIITFEIKYNGLNQSAKHITNERLSEYNYMWEYNNEQIHVKQGTSIFIPKPIICEMKIVLTKDDLIEFN